MTEDWSKYNNVLFFGSRDEMLYQYRNKMSSRWNKQGYNSEEENGIQYTKFPHTNHLLPHFITTFKSKQQQNHTRIYFVHFKYTFQLTYTICEFFIRWFQLYLYVCIRYICNKYNNKWPVKISYNIINSLSESKSIM